MVFYYKTVLRGQLFQFIFVNIIINYFVSISLWFKFLLLKNLKLDISMPEKVF